MDFIIIIVISILSLLTMIILLWGGLTKWEFIPQKSGDYPNLLNCAGCPDNPQLPFTKKLVLISGGTTGIGLATAIEFVKKGAVVLVGGRTQWKWDNVSKPYIKKVLDPKLQNNILYHPLDVRDYNSQKKFFWFAWNNSRQWTQTPSPRIDLVFNNAGVGVGGNFAYTDESITVDPSKGTINLNIKSFENKSCPSNDRESPQWVFSGQTIVTNKMSRSSVCNDSTQCYKETKTLATNQCESSKITDEYGQILSCKIAVGFMRGIDYMNSVESITDMSDTSENTWPEGNPPNIKGVIINTSSINALLASPGQMDYSIAKAASVILTKTTAVEQSQAWIKMNFPNIKNSQTIRVNTILPGPTDTPLMRANAPPGTACKSSYPSINGIDPNNDYNKWLIEASNNWSDKLEQIYKKELNTVFAGTMPNNYMGRPEEIAKPVLFLANNNQSSFLNGTSIVADGGMQTIWGTVPFSVACPKKPE